MWWCSAKTCHGYGLFYRGKAKPEAPFDNVGFRCARELEVIPALGLSAFPDTRS